MVVLADTREEQDEKGLTAEKIAAATERIASEHLMPIDTRPEALRSAESRGLPARRRRPRPRRPPHRPPGPAEPAHPQLQRRAGRRSGDDPGGGRRRRDRRRVRGLDGRSRGRARAERGRGPRPPADAGGEGARPQARELVGRAPLHLPQLRDHPAHRRRHDLDPRLPAVPRLRRRSSPTSSPAWTAATPRAPSSRSSNGVGSRSRPRRSRPSARSPSTSAREELGRVADPALRRRRRLLAPERRLTMTQPSRHVSIRKPEERVRVGTSGAVGSIQEAEITVDRNLLDGIWTADNLELIARGYWAFLRRISLGIIRVEYARRITEGDRLRQDPAAPLRRPRLRGRGGLPARSNGRSTAACSSRGRRPWQGRPARLGHPLRPRRRRRRGRRGSSSRCRLIAKVEVENFYPGLRGRGRFARLGAWIYAQTQLRIHVFVCNGYLRTCRASTSRRSTGPRCPASGSGRRPRRPRERERTQRRPAGAGDGPTYLVAGATGVVGRRLVRAPARRRGPGARPRPRSRPGAEHPRPRRRAVRGRPRPDVRSERRDGGGRRRLLPRPHARQRPRLRRPRGGGGGALRRGGLRAPGRAGHLPRRPRSRRRRLPASRQPPPHRRGAARARPAADLLPRRDDRRPGSESYELLRSIAGKLPALPEPDWLRSATQPIGIRDVVSYLRDAPAGARVGGARDPDRRSRRDAAPRRDRPVLRRRPAAGRRCGSRSRTGSPAPMSSPPGPPASPRARPPSPPSSAAGCATTRASPIPRGARLFEIRPEPLNVAIQRALAEDEGRNDG